MNRPFPLDVENELLRAAEEHPGQALKIGADGIARPAQDRHTPGPWTAACPPSSQFGTIRYIDADGFTVADVNSGQGEITQAEALANARLIATAPDLLALARLVATIEPSIASDRMSQMILSGHVERARAVIAKALA